MPAPKGKRGRRTYGEGGLYQRADGTWIGVVEAGYNADGKRRRVTVSSRDQATALRKLHEARERWQVHRSAADQRMTVAQWLDQWLAGLERAPGTISTYRHKVGLIKAAVGKVRLERLSPTDVVRVHQHARDGGRSDRTALHCHRVLHRALEVARKRGIVTRNVAGLVDAPGTVARTVTPLTAAEGIALLGSVADDPLAARWAAALLYGMRQGEVLGLEWSRVRPDGIDVSWQLRRITYAHGCGGPDEAGRRPCGRTRGAGCPARRLDVRPGVEYRQLEGGLCLTRPKSKAGWRVLPVTDWFAQILDTRRAISERSPNPHGLVFARPDGRPLDPAKDNAAWHAALAKAGLPGMPLHDARHTAATLLLEAGIDVHVATTILGHSDILTSRSYQHADRRLTTDALERVGRMLTPG